MKPVKVFFLFLLSFSIFCSCKKDETDTVKIRVKNTSSYYYSNIIVSDKNYGNIDSFDYSDYQIFQIAYRYAYVKLYIDTVAFIIQPVDFVGEENLKGGNYTYLIGVTDFQHHCLSIDLQKD
jgi:hypothetical protein